MSVRIGINGFGRIGRGVVRAAWSRGDLSFVHINDLTDPETLAWLLSHDSVYGRWSVPVHAESDALVIDGVRVPVTAERSPAALPWKDRVDVVMECTGAFRSRAGLQQHLDAGAPRVLLSAPAKGDGADVTVVYGVNHHTFDPAAHRVVSCASCTTNCLAPIASVLHDTAGIAHGWMSTVHAYTMDQNLLDAPHRKGDLRRARAAALNIVPTTTGAADAIGLVLPELAGRMRGLALRVPIAVGSLVDLTVHTERPTTREALVDALRAAGAGPLAGVLSVVDDPLVSSDIVGDPHSCIVSTADIHVHDGHLVKALAWYDNEAGFSHRMADLAALVGGSA